MFEYKRIKATIQACLKKLVSSDGKIEDLHLITKAFRGSSAYWRTALNEFVAKIRSLGPPTFSSAAVATIYIGSTCGQHFSLLTQSKCRSALVHHSRGTAANRKVSCHSESSLHDQNQGANEIYMQQRVNFWWQCQGLLVAYRVSRSWKSSYSHDHLDRESSIF
ncbi:unnamed protein product [Aphis gossypii]|uniref:Uncharacterized protein n=1 Tax=Aphis gossypii TaxID=80765 RepID=A0A9P0J7Z4_APHGO|nr:unnamed protein product [Aphis gossypii]